MSLRTRIAALFKGKEKGVLGGAGYPLPITGGSIPSSWPWNWWQQGRDPVGSHHNCASVYACASAYAQTIAACQAYHWRRNKNGGKEEVERSALTRFFRRPNSYQTRSDFVLNLVQQLMYEGNAYAVSYRNDRNEITEMHLLDARQTHPYLEPESKALFYGVSDSSNPMLASGLKVLVPARDVMHIRLYTPNHPLIGVSPIRYASLAVAANTAIAAHQAIFFNNMSRPSGVITTDQVLNREQMASLREAWKDQSQGLNSGQIPILHAGMKWASLSINSQDAELVEAFRMTVEDIARAFRVPLPLIGDTRNSTYNNVEQLISSWLATGLGFVLEHIELAIGHHFEIGTDEFVNFDTDTLLRTDFAGRIDALTKGIGGGLYSPNEARAKEGLPAVEFGDEPRVQAQNVPLSAAASIPAAPAAPAAPTSSEEPDDESEEDEEDENEDDEKEKIIALYTMRRKMQEIAA